MYFNFYYFFYSMIKFLVSQKRWQPSLTIPSGFDVYQSPHRNIARPAAKSINTLIWGLFAIDFKHIEIKLDFLSHFVYAYDFKNNSQIEKSYADQQTAQLCRELH